MNYCVLSTVNHLTLVQGSRPYQLLYLRHVNIPCKDSEICSLILILFLPLNRYNFLDKSVGISSLFEISGNYSVNSISQIVETRLPLHVPGVEGLLIPSKTQGHVLKVFGGNTALVRWEVYYHSAICHVFVNCLRLDLSGLLDFTF